MASIRRRAQADGSVKYAVLFRKRATGKQTSLTYATRDEAQRMPAVVAANGDDLPPRCTSWRRPNAGPRSLGTWSWSTFRC